MQVSNKDQKQTKTVAILFEDLTKYDGFLACFPAPKILECRTKRNWQYSKFGDRCMIKAIVQKRYNLKIKREITFFHSSAEILNFCFSMQGF